MKRTREFDAHRYLRRTRHSHGWEVPQHKTDKDWRKVAAFVVAFVVVLVIGSML